MPSNATAKIKSALKRREAWLLLLTLLVLGGIFWARAFSPNPILQAGNHHFELELTDTPDKHQRGLSGRTSMPRDRGMLFEFPTEDRQCFWMKDMHFSLDIIWVDSQKKIRHIARDLSPDTYPDVFCHDAARYVIELRGGEAAKAGMYKGQTLEF